MRKPRIIPPTSWPIISNDPLPELAPWLRARPCLAGLRPRCGVLPFLGLPPAAGFGRQALPGNIFRRSSYLRKNSFPSFVEGLATSFTSLYWSRRSRQAMDTPFLMSTPGNCFPAATSEGVMVSALAFRAFSQTSFVKPPASIRPKFAGSVRTASTAQEWGPKVLSDLAVDFSSGVRAPLLGR